MSSVNAFFLAVVFVCLPLCSHAFDMVSLPRELAPAVPDVVFEGRTITPEIAAQGALDFFQSDAADLTVMAPVLAFLDAHRAHGPEEDPALGPVVAALRKAARSLRTSAAAAGRAQEPAVQRACDRKVFALAHGLTLRQLDAEDRRGVQDALRDVPRERFGVVEREIEEADLQWRSALPTSDAVDSGKPSGEPLPEAARAARRLQPGVHGRGRYPNLEGVKDSEDAAADAAVYLFHAMRRAALGGAPIPRRMFQEIAALTPRRPVNSVERRLLLYYLLGAKAELRENVGNENARIAAAMLLVGALAHDQGGGTIESSLDIEQSAAFRRLPAAVKPALGALYHEWRARKAPHQRAWIAARLAEIAQAGLDFHASFEDGAARPPFQAPQDLHAAIAEICRRRGLLRLAEALDEEGRHPPRGSTREEYFLEALRHPRLGLISSQDDRYLAAWLLSAAWRHGATSLTSLEANLSSLELEAFNRLLHPEREAMRAAFLEMARRRLEALSSRLEGRQTPGLPGPVRAYRPPLASWGI